MADADAGGDLYFACGLVVIAELEWGVGVEQVEAVVCWAGDVEGFAEFSGACCELGSGGR